VPVAYKRLATTVASTTTKIVLYTVPAATQAIISSLVVTATFSTGSQTFSIYALTSSSETETTNNALGINLSISANTTIAFTEGWTLNAGETIAFVSGTASGLNFNLFGCEIS
jgi:hypothetical protein